MLALLALLAQDVEGQPLAANAARVVQAFELLGSPLGVDLAAAGEDPRKIKGGARSLDLLPRDARRPARGVAAPSPPGRLDAAARQGPQSEGLREPLAVASPRSGPVYAGAAPLSLKRQGQEVLRENENLRGDERFLQLELFGSPPMAPRLSGLAAEYAVLLVCCSTSGVREAETRPRSATFGSRPRLRDIALKIKSAARARKTLTSETFERMLRVTWGRPRNT